MSRREDSVTLRQMADHTHEAIVLSRNRNRADLESDRLFFLAMLKRVEIVGEAAFRVKQEQQVAHPEIPWREIIGTRNRLVHGYDAVDCDILWTIVTVDFPPLYRDLCKILTST